jgi:UDP-N-acetylmuramate--alanine ligase
VVYEDTQPRIWPGQDGGTVPRSAENPDLEARRRKLPVIPRGELLAELMRQNWYRCRRQLQQDGLIHANLDPPFWWGAYKSTTPAGQGEYLVVESDESDGSFLAPPSLRSLPILT